MTVKEKPKRETKSRPEIPTDKMTALDIESHARSLHLEFSRPEEMVSLTERDWEILRRSDYYDDFF